MKIIRHRDEGDVRLVVYAQGAHLFVYRYGVTLRFRRRENWRHVALRLDATRFGRSAPNLGRFTVYVETWRTAGGTTDRILYSKKYAKVRVLV